MTSARKQRWSNENNKGIFKKKIAKTLIMNTSKNQVLKISTSGSVDDGKSTLIGRILYDTKSLKQDKLKAIEENSIKKGYDYLDFSLATDGLTAEREQGITIDVAHIYFSSPNRSYIIADTPGHIEYTRNMITGTSTSDVSLILIDARNGVVEQTRRHYFINSLLRVKEVIVVINKMDLIGYDQQRFQSIIEDFKKLTENTDFKDQKVTFIPVSALHGENVVNPSENFRWYDGKTLMQVLEDLKVEETQEAAHARFQIQTVIRPKKESLHDFRGYAGKLRGGELKINDEVTILPSETKSTIKSIEFYDQQYESASKGSSITITLKDEVNVSRGDLIVKTQEKPLIAKELKAIICWMDKTPLLSSTMLYLQHGVKQVKSKITSIDYKIKSSFNGTTEKTDKLNMNDLGLVNIKVGQPLYFDTYKENKDNGVFILIDGKTNATAGVGFIQ